MTTATKEFVSDTEVQDTVLQDAKTVESKGKTRHIPIDSCYVDGNPREEHNIEPLVASMLRHGYLLNQPIVIVDMENDKFLVTRGNRRFLAICFIRENNPAAYAIIFPKGTVPAIVHKKCSAQEIALLRIDFDSSAERQPLTAWEEFLAVRVLVKAGYLTESGIAEKMGKYVDDLPARSWAQTRVRLARLPVDVQEMFRTVFLKTKLNTLRIGDIQKLASEYRDKSDCAAFRDLLNERADRETKTSTAGKSAVKFSITAKDVKDRINSFDSEIIRRLLGAMIGDSDQLTVIDSDLCHMVERVTLMDSLESQFSTEIEEMQGMLK